MRLGGRPAAAFECRSEPSPRSAARIRRRLVLGREYLLQKPADFSAGPAFGSAGRGHFQGAHAAPCRGDTRLSPSARALPSGASCADRIRARPTADRRPRVPALRTQPEVRRGGPSPGVGRVQVGAGPPGRVFPAGSLRGSQRRRGPRASAETAGGARERRAAGGAGGRAGATRAARGARAAGRRAGRGWGGARAHALCARAILE